MGELKCRPFELDLEEKGRFYLSAEDDRREFDIVATTADKELGDPSSWPGFAQINCNSLGANHESAQFSSL